MTTPLKRVEFIKAGEYAVFTHCGLFLRVKRNAYSHRWHIWNSTIGAPEWGNCEGYRRKSDALDAIRKSVQE